MDESFVNMKVGKFDFMLMKRVVVEKIQSQQKVFHRCLSGMLTAIQGVKLLAPSAQNSVSFSIGLKISSIDFLFTICLQFQLFY